MGKIIIHNNSHLSDEDAVKYVTRVMDDGKVSETKGILHYCCATSWDSFYIICMNRGEGKNTFYVETIEKGGD